MVGVAHSLHWGNVASWVESIATSVALLLTYGLLRVTRRDQQTARREQRQAQARKVSAWCERVGQSAGPGPDEVVVRLRNASDEPIYGPHVAVGADWWSKSPRYVELDLGYVIAPGYDEAHRVELRVGRTAADRPETSPPVELLFADAGGGRFWYRDRYGGLSEITDRHLPDADDYFFSRPANVIAPVLRDRLKSFITRRSRVNSA
ncbi:MAG TPA: hypothetical protein VMR14_08130 [Streptosporangiaceae bacterium]|nr:hypothetical protein [Streptosporangiaceae bacterium]